jgi:hypothetical protein
MISQRCPKCRSSRIRKGYKPTPLLLRLFGIHHLLCNHCNLLFTGFAVPGTVGRSSHKNSTRTRSDRNQGTVPDSQGRRITGNYRG